jgi:hypothetical protein
LVVVAQPRIELDPLNQLSGALWEVQAHAYKGGLHVRVRMTVARLRDGRLWLHSLVPIDDALAARLGELGEVGYLVAPNRFHHMFAAAAKQRYPSAQLWGAPGLARKRSDLVFDGELAESGTPWADDIETLDPGSGRMWSEFVFVHRASSSLICGDFLFNIHDEPRWQSRAIYRGLGVWKKAAQSRLWRWKIGDRSRAAAVAARLVEMDIERIVVAHGDVIVDDVAGQLRRCLGWLL